ncbi:MAG TPA: DUF402 domain-containing protein [Pseudogracilibacillus sp.]|nr:DUF402 domain-containing protein [Pseudogracilibacillus sp.]
MGEVKKEIKIVSKKHDGSFHRSWEKNIVLDKNELTLIGGNDKTIVQEPNRPPWITTEPALFYFHRNLWFNVIVLLLDDDYLYYCNISSPFTKKGHVLTYIDYDIDVIVRSDYSYEIVDVDEYKYHKEKYHYPESVMENIDQALEQIQLFIKSRKDPFNEDFVQKWKKQFELYQ